MRTKICLRDAVRRVRHPPKAMGNLMMAADVDRVKSMAKKNIEAIMNIKNGHNKNTELKGTAFLLERDGSQSPQVKSIV